VRLPTSENLEVFDTFLEAGTINFDSCKVLAAGVIKNLIDDLRYILLDTCSGMPKIDQVVTIGCFLGDNDKVLSFWLNFLDIPLAEFKHTVLADLFNVSEQDLISIKKLKHEGTYAAKVYEKLLLRA